MAYTPQFIRRIHTGNNEADQEYFDVAASQNIVAGNFLTVAAGVVSNAAAGTTGSIVGLANADISTSGSATTKRKFPAIPAKNHVIRMAFSNAGTKKTFTTADLYVNKYRLANATTLDPDNTTTGFLQVVGFDNANLTVDVVVTAAAQYLV